jgi:hypothetical protein
MIRLLTVIAAFLSRLRRACPLPPPMVITPTAQRIGAMAGTLDGFCARMNEGLAAFALVLALGLTVTTVVRHPEAFLPPPDADSGLATGDVLLTP